MTNYKLIKSLINLDISIVSKKKTLHIINLFEITKNFKQLKNLIYYSRIQNKKLKFCFFIENEWVKDVFKNQIQLNFKEYFLPNIFFEFCSSITRVFESSKDEKNCVKFLIIINKKQNVFNNIKSFDHLFYKKIFFINLLDNKDVLVENSGVFHISGNFNTVKNIVFFCVFLKKNLIMKNEKRSKI